MDEKLYTIGEIARIKGMTVKALRFYDRIGLLKPHRVDPMSQYRYYHADQFLLLDIIKAARGMDISPRSLIPYFQNKDTEGLLQLLDSQKEQALGKIELLRELIDGIEGVKSTLRRAGTSAGDRVYLRDLPQRHVITLPFDPGKSKEEILLDYSRLDIAVSERGLIPTYDTGVLFEKRGEEFEPVFLFTSILRKAPYGDYRQIPGGRYACVGYTEKTTKKQTNRLAQYLRQQDADPLDIVQVELLTDLFAGQPGIFELQARIA